MARKTYSSSKHGVKAKYTFREIVGISESITRAKEQAIEFARTDLNLLILGETGTGKELFAHSIHHESPRSKGPFVAINCATLPPNLLESELFGYEDGAFTGARKYGKMGLFELAHNGTIFLDEIGEMPLEIQARLLRVIEDKEVRRLGGGELIPVNVRVIAATNRDLTKAVSDRSFRADLFYRLNTLTLHIPPLRERTEDIMPLVSSFVAKYNCNIETRTEILALVLQALSQLQGYPWPGNVRELKNLVDRCCAARTLLKRNAVTLYQLLQETLAYYNYASHKGTERGDCDHSLTEPKESLRDIRRQKELEAIYAAGTKYNWNRQKMAAALGISTTTLWRKLKNLDVPKGR